MPKNNNKNRGRKSRFANKKPPMKPPSKIKLVPPKFYDLQYNPEEVELGFEQMRTRQRSKIGTKVELNEQPRLNPDVESVAADHDTDSDESEADDFDEVWLPHQRSMLQLYKKIDMTKRAQRAEALKLRGTKEVQTGKLRALINYMDDCIHRYRNERRRLRQEKHLEMICTMLLRKKNGIEKSLKTYQELKELHLSAQEYKQFVDKREELQKGIEQFNVEVNIVQKFKEVSELGLQQSVRHEEIRQFQVKGWDWMKKQNDRIEQAIDQLEVMVKNGLTVK